MSNLHVIAGSFKNRRLKSPKSPLTRPTTALLRKVVFDITTPLIDGAKVLDLFAGSGLMGIEALSRGAEQATFVEQNKEAMRCIKENIATCRIEEKATCLLMSASLAVLSLAKKGEKFDLIYCDPPYGQTNELLSLLLFIDEERLLQPQGMLFLEEASPASQVFASKPLTNLRYREHRTYGNSVIHIFRGNCLFTSRASLPSPA